MSGSNNNLSSRGPTSVFLLSVTGQVTSGYFPGSDSLYCKFCVVAGPDWAVTGGQEEGISQISKSLSGNEKSIWNFPLDITFRSTSPYGWPQIVFSVYEIDAMGNETIAGYGVTHVPLTPGSHYAKVPTFKPKSSSMIQRMLAYLTGRRPEYVDSRVIASGEGRDVTRVTSSGHVYVQMNVISKDLKRLGYDSTPGGPQTEIRNQGPSDGMGLVTKSGSVGDAGGGLKSDADPEAIDSARSPKNKRPENEEDNEGD